MSAALGAHRADAETVRTSTPPSSALFQQANEAACSASKVDVHVQASATNIGVEAFSGCSGLSKVSFPDGKTSGPEAFNPDGDASGGHLSLEERVASVSLNSTNAEVAGSKDSDLTGSPGM